MREGPIIDMHTHLWLGRGEVDEARLLAAAERYEISRLYVSSLGGYSPDMETVEKLNNMTHGFARRYPDLVGGMVYISPEHPNAMDVLRRGIEAQGMAGAKLWVSTFCDDPFVYPLAEQMIAYNLPLLVHSFHKANGQVPFETTGEHVARLARRYPDLKIMMAHLGGNAYHGLPAIRDCPNVWVDYCGSIFRGDELNYAVELLGVDRVMFGTDMPGSFLTNYGQILEADLTPGERRAILYDNAFRLFDPNFRIFKGVRA